MARKSAEDWTALRFEAMQLFSPSAPVDEAALFAGRQPQLHTLIETVLEKGKHAVLFGERGVGKTSLVKVFRLLYPSIVSEVRLMRESINPADTFTDVWRKVFKDIEVQTRGGTAISLSEYYDRDISADDVRRELAGAFSSNEIPIIVLDEFDRAAVSVRKSIAHVIKDLSDDGTNVTIIVVGVADNIDGLIDEHESLRRCIEQVPMPRMSTAEMREIITKRIPRLGMKIDSDALWKVVTLSRGLPSYVHLLGLYAVQSAIDNKRLIITEADVDTAIKRALDKSQESVKSDYAAAVHTNRKDTLFREVLLACALTKPDDDRGFFTPNAVVAPLESILRKSVKIANFQNHLKEFIGEERGRILDRIGKERAYKFRFSDPMMQPYVIMRGVEDGMIDAKSLDVLSSPEQPQFEFPASPQKPS